MSGQSEKLPVSVVAAAHPFRAEQTSLAIPEGASLTEIMAQVQPRPELRAMAHVFVGDGYVPRDYWHLVRPRSGVLVTIRMVPMGGGDGEKDPLRTVLTIAVIAGAMWVTGGAGGTFAAGSFGAAAAGAATSAAGMWLVNQIAPVAAPNGLSQAAGEQASQAYSLTGGRNQLAPYGVVPLVLGRHRIVPPYASMPYTEISGDDQYLRMLFNIGYGPVVISDMRIGETPLQTDGVNAFAELQVDVRMGEADDPPTSLFSEDVFEEQMSVLLSGGADWTVRTTQPGTDEIVIDVVFPQGMAAYDDKAKKLLTRVDIEAQYREVGAATWKLLAPGLEKAAQDVPVPYHYSADYSGDEVSYSYRRGRLVVDATTGVFEVVQGPLSSSSPGPIPATPAGKMSICTYDMDARNPIPTDARDPYFVTNGWFVPTQSAAKYCIHLSTGQVPTGYFGIEAKTSSAIRRSLRAEVPNGQYEIQIRRITADDTSGKVFDTAYLSTLRSITHQDPVAMPGVAKVAMRVKASDQLNGVVDQFNCVAQTICLDWDGSQGQWIERPTSNPASLYRYLLQGPMNKQPLPDSRLDLPRLQAWAEFCVANGLQFNAVIDVKSTLFELLNMVAAAGRASFGMVDGKFSVVWDKPQTVPVQMFTPRNSRGFSGEKVFQRAVHALKVQYMDAGGGYRRAERIVYADGYDESTATAFEQIELMGVTSRQQAWKAGRYHLAVLQLRPERYNLTVDIEHLVCTRGDLVRVAHDVPLWGVATGRLKSVTIDGLGRGTGALGDEELAFESGQSYGMEFRRSDGGFVRADVVPDPADPRAVLFVEPMMGPPAEGDLFVFGQAGLEYADLLVTKIEMLGDLEARLTLVDAAPGVHLADQGEIPPFDPRITVPPDLRTPEPPVVTGIRSDESVQLKNSDGSLTTRILITLKQLSGAAAAAGTEVAVQLRPEGVGPFRAANAFGVTTSEISVVDVEDGETYEVRLRTITRSGQPSAWISLIHTVVGKTTPPPNVSGAQVSVVNGMVRITWLDVAVADLDVYEVRHGGSDWESAEVVTRTSATHEDIQPMAPGVHTWRIKARDVAAQPNYSLNDAVVNLEVFAPAAPVPSIKLASSDYLLEWSVPESTFPITTYEVRHGEVWSESSLITQTSALSLLGVVDWVGERTFWLVAVDAGRNVGDVASITLAVNVPQAPQISAQLVVAKVALEWNAPASSLPIAEYEIRHGDDWETGTPITRVSGTSTRLPVSWLGARQFHIAAIDAKRNVGAAGSVIVPVNAPDAPAVTAEIDLDQIVIRWTEPTASLPIAEYAVGYGETAIGRVKGNVMRFNADFSGARTFWVRAYDLNENPGASGEASIEIAPPSAPTLTQQVVDNNVLLYWTQSVGTLPIKTYELRKGGVDWDTAKPIGEKSGGFTTVFETAGGTYKYLIAAIDSAGNLGAVGSVTATVNQPPDYVLQTDYDTDFHGKTIGALTRPTHRYVRRSFDNATELGFWTVTANDTLTQSTDRETGDYAGLFTSAETAPASTGSTGGNYFTVPDRYSGDTTRVKVRAKQPDSNAAAEFAVAFSTAKVGNSGWQRFTPTTEWAWYEFTYTIAENNDNGYDVVGIWADTAGTGKGVLIDRVIVLTDGQQVNELYIPVDPHQTFESHFTGNSWTSPQDQVNAGYLRAIQPGCLTGYYEEVIDQGTTLGGMKVSVLEEGETLAGNVTLDCIISVSNTSGSGPWTDYNQWEVFATEFRWVKVRLTVTGTDDSAVYKLTRMNVRIDARLKNDAGAVYADASDVGGTDVSFAISFIDVTSIEVSASGTSARIPVYDFLDEPFPTGFKALLFDTDGNRVSGNVSWSAKGY